MFNLRQPRAVSNSPGELTAKLFSPPLGHVRSHGNAQPAVAGDGVADAGLVITAFTSAQRDHAHLLEDAGAGRTRVRLGAVRDVGAGF